MVAYDIKSNNNSDSQFNDYITTKPNVNEQPNIDTMEYINSVNEQPIKLSTILDKHKINDESSIKTNETISLDNLSSLLKSSNETQSLPYTNYVIGGGVFIFLMIVLYNLYLYIIENNIFSKLNRFLNTSKPVEKTNTKKQEQPKKTNYKKEGFENNINGLDKAINGKINKNSLNSDVNFFSSDSDINSDNKISDDDISSSMQIGMTKDKHCYIGTDRGFRSCIEIGDLDKCMSGDIFPTHEMCINPSLRQ
jgi:uncharacterized protein YxeA